MKARHALGCDANIVLTFTLFCYVKFSTKLLIIISLNGAWKTKGLLKRGKISTIWTNWKSLSKLMEIQHIRILLKKDAKFLPQSASLS